METPLNNRSKRRSSLSSSNKPRKSIDSSASKIVKTLILKDKLRKQNQYKTAKVKRAELYEKKRHISNDQENQINQNDLEENKYKYEISSLNTNHVSNILQSNQDDDLSRIDELNESSCLKKTQNKENNQGISSKLSSTIARRLNSFKNTLKNIVNTTNNLKPSNLNIKNEVNNKIQKSFNNEQKVCKVRRSISMNSFPNNLGSIKSSTSISRGLKKQDSTSSCSAYNPITSSTLISNSSKNSIYSSTTSLSSKSCNQKPAFKITKIQYNDSYLYKKEPNILSESDKNKYQKMITNRKIAHMDSQSSFDRIK